MMRAQNLRHAATGVLVRDSWGRVYVHRRTPTKDVYPSRWDFTAGGVVLADEDPLDAARRELAEELGVTSDLVPLGEADYADDQTTYHAFRFVTTWDGPITPQPEEIAYGAWLSIERLLERLLDPDVEFMPDTLALFGDWLHARAAEKRHPEQGWDSIATVVEGRWIDRVPRFPDCGGTADQRDTADAAPRSAPPARGAGPASCWRSRRCGCGTAGARRPRAPPDTLHRDDGLRLGEFLRALHDMPANIYVEIRHPRRVAARAELLATLERMLAPRTAAAPRGAPRPGSALLRRVALRTPTSLIHGDLGPAPRASRTTAIVGVIDWSDARVGDPAIDLAWALYGTPEPFAEAVATAYGVPTTSSPARSTGAPLAPVVRGAVGPGPGRSGVRRVRPGGHHRTG